MLLREGGRSGIGGKKRPGRWCIRLQQTSPLKKWWNNMESHESSTKTDLSSLCQGLAFPCVWATVIHGTGVPVPPHARLPLKKVKEIGCHMRIMVRQSPNDLPVKLPCGDKQEVTTSTVDIYQNIHLGWVMTTGNMMWLQTSKGTCMYGGGSNISAHWSWQIVDPVMNVTNHRTGSW